MCEPTTIAYAAAAMTAVSTYSQVRTQKGMAEYQAGVARNNATLAEIEARDALDRGNQRAAEMRRKYAAMLGTQRAQFAARGIDIADGSANAVLNDTAYFGQVDENTVRANAAREAWGYQVKAQNFMGDAGAYSAQADAMNPLLSAGLSATSTYLSTQAAVNPKWYSRAGVPTQG